MPTTPRTVPTRTSLFRLPSITCGTHSSYAPPSVHYIKPLHASPSLTSVSLLSNPFPFPHIHLPSLTFATLPSHSSAFPPLMSSFSSPPPHECLSPLTPFRARLPFPPCAPYFPPVRALLSPRARLTFPPCAPYFPPVRALLSPRACLTFPTMVASFLSPLRGFLSPRQSLPSPQCAFLSPRACLPFPQCAPSFPPVRAFLSPSARLPFPQCAPSFPPVRAFLSPSARLPFPPCVPSFPPVWHIA
ncbi:unnamed protein product [Closterium sp. Naga37s-1]|nr:unnamed protein product [Closterium sp. Naga37s-1]